MTQSDLIDICEQMGFKDAENVRYHLLDPVDNSTHIMTKYGNAGVRIVSPNKYSTLNINDKFNLTSFQPSRTSVKIEAWNKFHNEHCYQLAINCESDS